MLHNIAPSAFNKPIDQALAIHKQNHPQLIAGTLRIVNPFLNLAMQEQLA